MTPSLLHLFDAPEDYDGLFGWVCGYSADALFLGEAAERFTRRTQAQRAKAGEISLGLILDPQHEALSLLDVPGVAHLPLRRASEQPFKLMHAKVALLGFRKASADAWLLRLIVSTGNWTQQTVEESLDLAWSIELSSEELVADARDLPLRCADIKAASEMVGWLVSHFDLRILDAMSENPCAADRVARFNDWVGQCASRSDGQEPRFFDNRSRGLLEQLPDRITQHAGKVRRNYLAMASGFFEDLPQAVTDNAPGQVPTVLARIEDTLRSHDMLTRNALVEVYVNPESCQAVAVCLEAMSERSWAVLAPGVPERVFGPDAHRTLHAKFLLGGNDVGDACSSGWVYLGSGNLTNPGFIQRAARTSGNLEAGVVFSLPRTPWLASRDPTVPALTVLLPIQTNGIPLTINERLKAGDPMPEHNDAFLAAPVAYLQWMRTPDGGLLRAPGQNAEDVEVLGPDGAACVRTGLDWLWPGEAPRQARLRWGAPAHQEQLVPVIDEYGRIAATELPELELQDLAAQLLGFPAIDVGDHNGGDDDETDASDKKNQARGGGSSSQTAAIRTMMTQLELIAQKQVEVADADWTAWCHRLEQTLCQARGSAVLADFRLLKIDPLSCLRQAAFRPDYARDARDPHGRRYEEALQRVAESWDVQEGYLAFGEET
ncbi:phospholipase D family protein [Achromobacter animicus]|uniref:phospholipase D family protein n=1 Tax=Achromobacter animicus TaxID=1389935 RepID=UPI0028A91223|nr:phospholipase D family protein [Achromobacter animicus]